jgi:hypothetical protein
MRRPAIGLAGSIGLALGLVALAPSRPALGNGEAARDIQGRVASVDARAGTLEVVREFRGKRLRLSLRAGPATPVYACRGERATLDRVQVGMTVSVFYEVLGAEGVANTVIVPPGPS